MRRTQIGDADMTIYTPTIHDLKPTLEALSAWQSDDAPWQIHPGDIGWFWRFGADATADAVRTWSRDGQILAVGLLDGDDLMRMTFAPDLLQDEALAREVVTDLVHPDRGVLPDGEVFVEAPSTALVQSLLADAGWGTDEPWQPLQHELSELVPQTRLRVEVVESQLVADWIHAIGAAFDHSTFTEQRWHAMAAGIPFADGRCLVGYAHQDVPVAAICVWSAGVRKPGLIEPMGVHRDHRGRGYGKVITTAGATALRDMGASCARVYTQSSNVGAVATYRSAGFRPLPEIRDRRRDG